MATDLKSSGTGLSPYRLTVRQFETMIDNMTKNWIVNLSSRQLEAYGAPDGRGPAAAYRDAATYGPDAAAPVMVDGREVGRIGVRDLLP